MRALLLTFTAVSLLIGRQRTPELVISVGHAGPPDYAVFAGNSLITAAASRVAVIDLSSGLAVGRLPQESLVTALAAGPQADLVAVGTCDHAIQLFDVRHRTLIRRFPLPQECPESLAFSPDGSLLASAAYGCQRQGVQVWEAGTGRLVRELAMGTGIRHVTFSGDGRWLAAVDDKGSARLFEWPSGRELRTFEGLGDTGYSGWVAMASGDGRYFAWKGHGLRVWDVSSGVEVPLPGARSFTVWDKPSDGPERRWTERHVTADAAGFLNDGRLAFVSDDELITMRLPDGPREASSLAPADYDVFGDVAIAKPRSWLAIRGDGMLLAASRESKTVLWDVAAKRLRELSAPALTWPQSLRWSSRGLVAWADLGAGLRGWDDRRGIPVDFQRSADSANGLAFRPDGARVAVAGGSSLRVLDLPRRRIVASHATPSSFGKGVAYTPGGDWIAFESDGGFVLFDGNLRRGGRIAALEEHTSVEHAAFSPDGRWIAAGLEGPNPSLRVWPVDRSKQNAATLDTARLTYGAQPPAFSSDSRRLASFTRGTTLTIWSTGDWRIERSWSLTGSGEALAFAPTGPRLAVATHQQAAVWDADTGRKRVTLSTSEPLDTTGIAWSPDGSRIVTSADDGVLRFWNASDGGLLASLYTLEESGDWLLVAADGRLDGSDGALTRLVAWRAGDRVFQDQALTARRRVSGLWRLLAPPAPR